MSFLFNLTGSVLRAEQVFNDDISVNKSFGKKALLETKLAGSRESWGEGQAPPYWIRLSGKRGEKEIMLLQSRSPADEAVRKPTNLALSHAVCDNPEVMCMTGFFFFFF